MTRKTIAAVASQRRRPQDAARCQRRAGARARSEGGAGGDEGVGGAGGVCAGGGVDGLDRVGRVDCVDRVDWVDCVDRAVGVPSRTALTASTGSRGTSWLGDPPSGVAAGMTVVRCSSGGGVPRFGGPLGASGADRPPSSLVTARACRPGARRALRPPGGAEHVRLHQVVPTARPADLHDVYRELREPGGEQDQLFGGARRSGHRAQVIAEDPRDQRELLLATDRTRHRTAPAVKLRGPQQIGIGVADFRDPGSAAVHLGQQ